MGVACARGSGLEGIERWIGGQRGADSGARDCGFNPNGKKKNY